MAQFLTFLRSAAMSLPSTVKMEFPESSTWEETAAVIRPDRRDDEVTWSLKIKENYKHISIICIFPPLNWRWRGSELHLPGFKTEDKLLAAGGEYNLNQKGRRCAEGAGMKSCVLEPNKKTSLLEGKSSSPGVQRCPAHWMNKHWDCWVLTH